MASHSTRSSRWSGREACCRQRSDGTTLPSPVILMSTVTSNLQRQAALGSAPTFKMRQQA